MDVSNEPIARLEATQQVIEVFQSEDTTDKLLAELEKEVRQYGFRREKGYSKNS